MKNKKSTILALALSISFVVSAQTAFAEEAKSEENHPTEAIETLKEETSEENSEEEKQETEEEAKPLEEDEEASDNDDLEISDLEEKEALGSPESDAFEQAADNMFDGISKKEGVYDAVYDKYGKNVTVTILDETQGAKEISGTGLVAGLTKLYNENNLVKIKVGSEDERDLKALAAAAPTSGMTVEQLFKLTFGTDILNAAQSTGKKTGTLKDFVGKTVNLVLTLENGDTLVYTINGVNAKGEIPEEKPEDKPENNENGYKTKEAAEKAAQAALENDPVNKSYTISQNGDGRYIYLLSSYEKIDTPEEDPEDPETDDKEENNENGYKTKEAALKDGEEALPGNMKDNFKVTADQGTNGRWFYRFEVKEEEKPTPKPDPNPDKPNPDKPVVPDHPSNPVVPGTTSDSDDETKVDTDDKVEEENKDENKAKDLIEKITKNTKEIEKILKENEANQEGNDKKEEPTKDPEKEPEKDDKKKEKQAPAKKHSNPKTGVVSMAPIVASFAISMSSLVALRKKND